MIRRATIALGALALTACGASAHASTAVTHPPVVASEQAVPVGPLPRETRALVGGCVDMIPADLVEQARNPTDEALFSRMIGPCVAAAIAVDGTELAGPFRLWLNTLMAMDEDYDTTRSLLDETSFRQLAEGIDAFQVATTGI